MDSSQPASAATSSQLLLEFKRHLALVSGGLEYATDGVAKFQPQLKLSVQVHLSNISMCMTFSNIWN